MSSITGSTPLRTTHTAIVSMTPCKYRTHACTPSTSKADSGEESISVRGNTEHITSPLPSSTVSSPYLFRPCDSPGPPRSLIWEPPRKGWRRAVRTRVSQALSSGACSGTYCEASLAPRAESSAARTHTPGRVRRRASPSKYNPKRSGTRRWNKPEYRMTPAQSLACNMYTPARPLASPARGLCGPIPASRPEHRQKSHPLGTTPAGHEARAVDVRREHRMPHPCSAARGAGWRSPRLKG
ncbi:hypothetical protein C8Q80DRAFT_737652 [Daedaleopsis nitida]|nr:hypothetical protein C8Q80DRAFT_737652 [Daedaleopsis nitida]